MRSDVPAFKVLIFANDFEFSIEVVDIPIQILPTILLPIDYSSRCKLKVYIMTHTKRKPPRGGGVLSPKSYVDVPAGLRKSDYLYTNFLPNFPPISIPFSKEKHLILTKLGAFYNNLPKIHPIYVIWAPSSLMKTP